MNENDKSRSGLQTAVDFAHAARAAKRIMQAAAVSGVHGAAAATAREAFPLLLKVLVAALVVFIVMPMVIFTALPNIFFGYNSSGTDTVIQMTQQAMTLGGVYMTLGNFEGAQIDSVVTGIAAEYEKNGTTIDHIVVTSAMTDDDLLWVIAINSAAHQQDLNTMSADLIRDFCKSSLALTDGAQMNPNKLQKTLEQTMEHFERSTLELRQLCERYSPGVGGFAHKPVLPAADVAGSVESFGYGWLHITLHTLLPHCRYQTPNWLSDTLRRLLDEYETCGKKLPFYSRAMLVIDEHTGIEGRHIYDQDNKGWKAISNAIKGRLIPDDDQHTLAVALLSTECFERECCHITLLPLEDAHDFFAAHSSDYASQDFYSGQWC